MAAEKSISNDMSLTKKSKVHRRMVSLPSLETIVAKSKLLLSTSTPEILPLSESPAEESNHVTLISYSPLPSEPESVTISETDELNASSLSYLQTTERRVDHRRNKSDPVKSPSVEDLPSAVNNDSATASPSLDSRKKTTPLTGTSSRKKKPWYNPFQSTYRERYEEFRKLFKDISENERLVVDYSCAWQKDILVQGRMYLSPNYLCFYANILNWKSHLCLKLEDIADITREKTAKVISNAIEIKTKKGEKYFFASFVTRDKTYAILHRLCKAVASNQPISTQQIWTLIRESYGDDLDVTTDDDDSINKSSLNTPSPKSPVPSMDKYDRLASNSVQVEDDRSSLSSSGEHPSEDEGMIPIGEEARTNTLMRRPQSNTIEQEISSSTEITYLADCSCEKHLATELINRSYSMSVEQLYDCIFGDNDFLVAYRASRRIKDCHAGEWKVNVETGKRERLLTYKVTVSAVFGSTTICSNERQIIDCEQSKSHYILDTEVRNEGIKYADAFFVASRYCLVQTAPHKSHLKVTCEVRYVKSLMAIIKTFIEKNAMAALQDSFTDLMKRIDQESSKRSRAPSISQNDETEELVQSPSPVTRRLSRQQQQQIDELLPSVNDLPSNSYEEESRITSADVVRSDSSHSFKNKFFVPFCFVTMTLLLIVNVFLWIKLNQIDRMTDRLVHSQPSWWNHYSTQPDDNHWPSLLKRQEEYYQTQLDSLHSVLTTTQNALRNVTDTLKQLSKFSSR